MVEQEMPNDADIHFSAKDALGGGKETNMQPQTAFARELATIRTRILTDEKPATRFDALYLAQAELADSKDEADKKALKKTIATLTELVTGHTEDVHDADQQKAFAYLQKHQKQWEEKATADPQNTTAKENAVLFGTIAADLMRGIEKETAEEAHETLRQLPALPEYSYTPHEANSAVEEMPEQPEFSDLHTFIQAVGKDFDTEWQPQQDSSTVNALKAALNFYDTHPFAKDELLPITINVTPEGSIEHVGTDQPGSLSPDSVIYSFDPARDGALAATLKNYELREETIADAQETTQKLLDGQRIDPEEAFTVGQFLQQHINYLKTLVKENPQAERKIEALTALGDKVNERIKAQKKTIRRFKRSKK